MENGQEVLDATANSLQQVMDLAVAALSTWGLRVIGAMAVLVIGRMIAGRVRNLTTRGLERAEIDVALIPFLASLAYYLVLTVVIIAVLNLFGIATTSLVAVLGAAGLAIGLALQGTLSNVASGVMLLVFRPFRPGDFVEVAGVAGTAAEVGLFTVVLNTPDNVRITIPNSAVFGNTILNYSANPTRRIDLVIGVSYTDDLGLVGSTIEKILAEDPRVLADTAPTVATSELADSSVNFVVRPWCKKEDYWPLRFDLTRRIKEQLEAAGCSIPYPQQDVHMIPAGNGQ